MAVTSKGKGWEIRHSLWILWTFSLGFFNWVAFFYIGIRARQRKWIFWGLSYSIPFILAMIFAERPSIEGWVGDLIIVLTLVSGVISIVHAFRARREYLVRLEALQSRGTDNIASLRRRIEAEYGAQTRSPAPSQQAARTSPSTDVPRTDREQSHQPTIRPPDAASSMDRSASTVDLNNSSEQELATLPGVGLIIAKRATGMRESRGGFRSVEDFGAALGLKPHVVERIRPLVSVGQTRRARQSSSQGRVVDF